MQINTTDGHIIIINRIKVDKNIVECTEYEVGVTDMLDLVKVKDFSYEFKTVKLKDYLNLLVNYTDVCKEKLIEELGLTITGNDDLQNWLFTSRDKRVVIENSLVLEALQPINADGDVSPLGQIVERVKKQHFGYYIDNTKDKMFVVYVNTVADEDAPILAQYFGNRVWVDIKD